MKKLFSLFAILSLAVGFTACEKSATPDNPTPQDVTLSADKGEILADGTDVVTFTVDETKWLLKDGYYYHLMPVATESSTEILFDEVYFAPTMGNEYQNCKTEIIVYAQAVQTANNGTTVEEAAGWPEALPVA